MKGAGHIAAQIHQQFALAKQKYLPQQEYVPLHCDLHAQYKDGQLKLF